MPINARIRPARTGEHEAVAACARAAYAKYIERIGREPAPMLADYATLIEQGTVHVLDGGDGAVAGILVLKQVGDAMLVENVAVWPSRQGSGLGREMMRFAEELARHKRLREINLYTNERMAENVAFYEELGYREVDRRLDDGYRRVFMSKGLPEA